MTSFTELVVYDSPIHGRLTIHCHWLDAVSVIAARWARNRTAHNKQHFKDMQELWGYGFYMTAEGDVKRGDGNE